MDVKVFYGQKASTSEEKKSVRRASWIKCARKMPSHILGPTQFWQEFDRQADAIVTASEKSDDYDTLCTFVYQRDSGYRRFVVAHPEVYWWYYKARVPEEKCSYEVIPENSPCRLYLDLEYPTVLNPQSNGPRITNTLINVFCSYLFAFWNLPCNRYNIVDLDSSTNEKFSRHVIFNINNIAFKNNYHVGRLVKFICKDILDYVTLKKEQHDILSHFNKVDIENLLVETKSGKKLFADTAVYTKNRHFRIYQSTKWGKMSPLLVSEDCKYIPSSKRNDRELSIFLDSLISYFPNKKDLILLEFSNDDTTQVKRFATEVKQLIQREDVNCTSQYPLLDKYISTVVYPGKIRLCKFFESSKMLVYETTDYRYCENIKRCHKSNNVFLIVDLNRKIWYQKCHDQDCRDFKSEPKNLPEEIYFHLDDDSDVLLTSAIVPEDIADQSDCF